jgi:hypothetical protein
MMARLHLAGALVFSQNNAKVKAAPMEFLALRKSAEPEIPVRGQAENGIRNAAVSPVRCSSRQTTEQGPSPSSAELPGIYRTGIVIRKRFRWVRMGRFDKRMQAHSIMELTAARFRTVQ